MTPTQKQIIERLHKIRDERAGIYECETQHKERACNENGYKYRDFQAGFDSTNEIIMKLVAVVEFYGQPVRDQEWIGNEIKPGAKARQLLEELKGGVE